MRKWRETAALMRGKMEYISSDTNVWIDFSIINKMALPFRLPYTYLMNGDAIEDELLNPANLKQNLLNLGLKKVELDIEELLLAVGYALKYKQLSRYDRIALAIAKNRRITLLTGDKRLREAARKECVPVVGTLGILDKLYARDYINESEYDECINELMKHNGCEIRLPVAEMEQRLTPEGKLFVKSADGLK